MNVYLTTLPDGTQQLDVAYSITETPDGKYFKAVSKPIEGEEIPPEYIEDGKLVIYFPRSFASKIELWGDPDTEKIDNTVPDPNLEMIREVIADALTPTRRP